MSHTHASTKLQVEVGATVLDLHIELDVVGQVEAALGLDDVLEHRKHVPVLAIQLQLDFRLVPLEILGAHEGKCTAAPQTASDRRGGRESDALFP